MANTSVHDGIKHTKQKFPDFRIMTMPPGTPDTDTVMVKLIDQQRFVMVSFQKGIMQMTYGGITPEGIINTLKFSQPVTETEFLNYAGNAITDVTKAIKEKL